MSLLDLKAATRAAFIFGNETQFNQVWHKMDGKV
jgi:hypothetical protein